MAEGIFATCPNCQSRMKVAFIRDIEVGEDFFNQEKIGEFYEGKCSICHLKMSIRKPT